MKHSPKYLFQNTGPNLLNTWQSFWSLHRKSRCLKSSAESLCYNNAHAVTISYGKIVILELLPLFWKIYNLSPWALREKCPNTEFFLVRIHEGTDQKILRISTIFTQWKCNKLFYTTGDFNLHVYNQNEKATKFLSLTVEYGLVPVINKPIWATKTTAIAVDHIFMNSILHRTTGTRKIP